VFLGGFCGVFLLVIFGGSHHVAVLGLALILSGTALVIHPPSRGLGKLGDLGALGLLACLLLAFVPQFYWPMPGWRVDAVQSLGLELPSSLSIQPWISFEAWLMAVAGFAWLYAALQWKVNLPGRRWLFFWLSILLSVIAGIVVCGNLVGARYPGAEEAGVFSFFPSPHQTANFLLLGGLATFAYAMEGIRTRDPLPLIGVPASALCLGGLFLLGSPVVALLYFAGSVLWLLVSLRVRSWPRAFKIGLPLAIIFCSLFLVKSDRAMDLMSGFATSDSQINQGGHLNIFQDTTKLVLDAPLSGFGLGSFSAVFPQYQEASASYLPVLHPQSDFLWLASEGGLLAVGFLIVFLIAYALRCRGITEGGSGNYRLFALVAVIIFLLHGLVDVPGHRPGTVYFAMLFAALAMPSSGLPKISLPIAFWRIPGVTLIAFGLMWLVAGAFNSPWHTSVRVANYQEEIRSHASALDHAAASSAVNSWLALSPLDWRGYFQRAELILSNTKEQDEAASDFIRARFVEPISGIVSFEEGIVWLPHNATKAISAWRETFLREMEDMDSVFDRMLVQAASLEMREKMARLSEINPHLRARLLSSLKGEALISEISHELSEDPFLSDFDRGQRSRIVENWIKNGDLSSANVFLSEYGESLNNTWWLRSSLLQRQGNLQEAIDLIRKNIDPPSLPKIQKNEAAFIRLLREHAAAPNDAEKGIALIYIYVAQRDYGKALPIIDRLLEGDSSTLNLYYWRGECLYLLHEYVESWDAFGDYLEAL
jgi:tetratricopeptide (TPR) repeat protein